MLFEIWDSERSNQTINPLKINTHSFLELSRRNFCVQLQYICIIIRVERTRKIKQYVDQIYSFLADRFGV